MSYTPAVENLADQILEYVAEYARRNGPAVYPRRVEWVAVRHIRSAFPAVEGPVVDAALTAISARGHQVVPESNQKTLTEADRAARAWVGGQWRDLVEVPR